MAKREDQEKKDEAARLQEALKNILNGDEESNASTAQNLKSYAQALREVEERTKSVTSQLGRLGKELSRSDQAKLVDESKDIIRGLNKHIKKYSDEEIDAIKDLDSLGLATRDLEEEYKSLTTLTGEYADKYERVQKRLTKSGMSQIQKDLLLEDAKEKYIRSQAKAQGLTDEQIDAVLRLVPQLKNLIGETDKNVGAMTKMRAGVERVTDSLKSQASGFFTLENATDHAKKAFTQAYDEMSRLSSQGLLGAFTQIQVASKVLYMSTEDLQKVIHDNRQYINALGGGLEGIKKFTKEVEGIQSDIIYLGKNSGTSAVHLAELANQSGLANDSQEMFSKNVGLTVKHFKQMNKMYGTGAEEYKDLMLAQQREESVTMRLSTLRGQDLLKYQEELRLRTENLKQMGFSNDQIKEFNHRLETIYDPNKDTYEQQVRESVYARATIEELHRSLLSMQGKGKTPEENEKMKATLSDFEKRKERLYQLTDVNMTPEQRAALNGQPGTTEAKRTFEEANAIVTQKNLAQNTTVLNRFKGEAGSLMSEIMETGKQALQNKVEGRDVSGKTDEEKTKIEKENRETQAEDSFSATVLRWETVFFEGIKRALDSPIGHLASAIFAAGGAILGLPSVISKLGGFVKGAAGAASGAAAGAAGAEGAAGAGGAAAGTGAAAAGIGKFANAAKGAGVGIGGLGLELGGDYLRDNTNTGSVEQGLGIGASVAGSTLSMAGTGAAIGSIVPGIGTAIGAGVGAIGGAAYGVYKNWGAAQEFDRSRATSGQEPKTVPSPGAGGPQASGKAKPILDLIGKTEGTDKGRGYNETLGYGQFTGGDVDLENMTISQVFKLQDRMLSNPANRMNSSAVGRYQIVKKTLVGLVKQLGIDPNTTKFDRDTQDMLATELLRQRGLDKVVNGQMGVAAFQNNLSKEWASIPNSSGTGTYSGQRTGGSMQDVASAVQATVNGTGTPVFSDESSASSGQSPATASVSPLSAAASVQSGPVLVQLDRVSIERLGSLVSRGEIRDVSRDVGVQTTPTRGVQSYGGSPRAPGATEPETTTVQSVPAAVMPDGGADRALIEQVQSVLGDVVGRNGPVELDSKMVDTISQSLKNRSAYGMLPDRVDEGSLGKITSILRSMVSGGPVSVDQGAVGRVGQSVSTMPETGGMTQYDFDRVMGALRGQRPPLPSPAGSIGSTLSVLGQIGSPSPEMRSFTPPPAPDQQKQPATAPTMSAALGQIGSPSPEMRSFALPTADQTRLPYASGVPQIAETSVPVMQIPGQPPTPSAASGGPTVGQQLPVPPGYGAQPQVSIQQYGGPQVQAPRAATAAPQNGERPAAAQPVQPPVGTPSGDFVQSQGAGQTMMSVSPPDYYSGATTAVSQQGEGEPSGVKPVVGGATADQMFDSFVANSTPYPVQQVSQVQTIEPASVAQPADQQYSQPQVPTPAQDLNRSRDGSDQIAELKKHTDLLATIVVNTSTTRTAHPAAYQRDRAAVLNGSS